MNKKFMMMILLVVLVVGQATSFAAELPIKLIVDDVVVQLDQAPVKINNRVLAPISAVYNAMGLEYTWNGATKTVDANKEGISIQIQVDNKTAIVNGEKVEMDVAAAVIGGRTLVPVSFIARALSLEVSWDGVNQAVIINTNTSLEPEFEDEDDALNHQRWIPEHDAYSFVEATDFLSAVSESYNVSTVIDGNEKALNTNHKIEFKFYDKADATMKVNTNNAVSVKDLTTNEMIYSFHYATPTKIMIQLNEAHEALNETLAVVMIGIFDYENGQYIADELSLYVDEHTDSNGYLTANTELAADDRYYIEGYKVRFVIEDQEIGGKAVKALVGITIE